MAEKKVALLLQENGLAHLEAAFESIGLLDNSADAVLAAGSVCIRAMLLEEEIGPADVTAAIDVFFGSTSSASLVDDSEETEEPTVAGDAMKDFLNGLTSDSDDEDTVDGFARFGRVEDWDHSACLAFFESLPPEAGIIALDPETSYSGADLVAALSSVRELKHLGLVTPQQRVAFEKCLQARMKAPATSRTNKSVGFVACTGTAGGLYSKEFLDVSAPLYEMCMGVENMAPLLSVKNTLRMPCCTFVRY